MLRLTTLAAGVLSLAALLAGAGPLPAQNKDDKKPDPADVQKQIDEIRKEMERHREEMRKQMDELRALLPGRVRPAQPAPGVRLARMDGRLGVMVDRPGDALADHLGLKENKGLLVTQVMPDTPAA